MKVFLLAACFGLLTSCGSQQKGSEVVLFASLDKIFSEPIAQEFEKETGIKVRLVTDVEASKTVGLVNRLIQRKEYPEADVYWNNELGQTFVLKEQGILEKYHSPNAKDIPDQYKDAEGYWTGFAARSRVILYNTNLVKKEEAPTGLMDLVDPKWKGKVAIAKPLFGTTFTHTAALFAMWGPEKTKAFLKGLKENKAMIVPGNAMARNMVRDGEVAVCLTDTDDANGAFLKQAPVEMVYPDQTGTDGKAALGAMVIPNSVMLIKNGPNSENAKKLIDFIVSKKVEAQLAKGDSAQFPLRDGVEPFSERFDLKKIQAMDVDWGKTYKQFDAVKAFIQNDLNW